MNVKQLRELLAGMPDDATVILQKDAEGNGHSPLSDVYSDMVYVPYNTWSGEVHLRSLTDEDRASGFTEEDVWDGDDGIPAVVLRPIN